MAELQSSRLRAGRIGRAQPHGDSLRSQRHDTGAGVRGQEAGVGDQTDPPWPGLAASQGRLTTVP